MFKWLSLLNVVLNRKWLTCLLVVITTMLGLNQPAYSGVAGKWSITHPTNIIGAKWFGNRFVALSTQTMNGTQIFTSNNGKDWALSYDFPIETNVMVQTTYSLTKTGSRPVVLVKGWNGLTNAYTNSAYVPANATATAWTPLSLPAIAGGFESMQEFRGHNI